MTYVRVRITSVKLMYKYHIDTLRARIYHSQPILQIINNIDETIHYTAQLSIGIVDIYSLGYYNVTNSVLFFDKREIIRFLLPYIKMPKLYLQNYYKASQNREVETKRSDPYAYPWLDLNYPRRYMTDEQILEIYTDLSSSDLNTEEKIARAKPFSFGILSKKYNPHTPCIVGS